MSLSRQERRRIAREKQKQQAFDRRYGKQVEERQNKIDDKKVEEDGVKFSDLEKELKDKTDIEFVWKR